MRYPRFIRIPPVRHQFTRFRSSGRQRPGRAAVRVRNWQRPVTLSASLKSATHTVGRFSVTWDADLQQVRVQHAANPSRFLWATLPGEHFVSAGYGQETFHEIKGNFSVRDAQLLALPFQTLDAIDATEDTVTLRGTLQAQPGSTPHVPYALTFTAPAPNQLRFHLELAGDTANRAYLTYASQPDEHIFGFGEQFSYFDLKGKRLPLFVMEQGVGRGAQPITFLANMRGKAGGAWHTTYAGVPHYLTSKQRSLYLESYAYTVFDMRAADRITIKIFGAEMCGRILYGETPADLIREYTQSIGRMRPLPDWVMDGAVVGIQGGTEKIRHVYDQLRAHDVPVAALWLQDWVGQRRTSFGKQLWWNWELDRDHYPGWEALVQDLADDDTRMLTYTNPFLVQTNGKGGKNGTRRSLFDEAARKGYLVKNSAGEPYMILITSFSAALVDLTNPAAWDWYKDVLKQELISAGSSGWMADFGEGLPCDAVLHSGEPAAVVHNRYPELWAKLNREIIDESTHGDDLIAFHRSGYRESPRYTTLFWLGDQLVSWDWHDGLKSAIIGLLSSGISGYSLNHSDIGGYTTIDNPLRSYHRDEELLLRWMEFSAMTVVFRSHEGNRPDRNAQVYSTTRSLDHFARCAAIYQAWGFYRKQLVQEAAESGMPVARHLYLHYPDDPAVYTLSYQAYLLGTEILVAPVSTPKAETLRVYLPAGEWTHVWTGETFGSAEAGTTVTVPAPLGEPGLFVRAGSEVGAQFMANLRDAGLVG